MNNANVSSVPSLGRIALLGCALISSGILLSQFRDELSALILPSPSDGLDDIEREFLRGLGLNSPFGAQGLETSRAMAYLAAFHESLDDIKRAAEYKLPVLNRLEHLHKLVKLGVDQSSNELCHEGLNEGTVIIKALYANDPKQLNQQLLSLQAPLRHKIAFTFEAANRLFENEQVNEGLKKIEEAHKLIQPTAQDLQDVLAECFAMMGMGYWLKKEYKLSLENYKSALVTFGYGVKDNLEPKEWWKIGVVNSLDSLILVQQDFINSIKDKNPTAEQSEVIRELEILASLQSARGDIVAEKKTLEEVEQVANSMTKLSK